MAATGRQPGPALSVRVVGQYGRFDAFQLVRLLRHRSGGQWPLAARVRFRAELDAAFPGHEISRLRLIPPMPEFRLLARGEATLPQRLELRTANYCLASELGPLPQPFLDWVRDQERIGGHAMAAFFDVFNQRIHVLRHELKQATVRALDDAPPARTRHAAYLAAVIGMGQPALQQQIPLPPRAWLGLAGLLMDRRRSAAVVAQVMSAYLGVPCTLRSLVGQWRPIEEDDRLMLGKSAHRLGQDTLLGRSTWDARSAVELEVAPQPYAACCALMPLRPAPGLVRDRADDAADDTVGDAAGNLTGSLAGSMGGHAQPGAAPHSTPTPPQASTRPALPSPAHLGLVAMLRLLLDRRFDCRVVLHVDPDTAQPSRLSAEDAQGGLGLRLSHTARLGRYDGKPLRFTVPACDPVAATGRVDSVDPHAPAAREAA